MKTAQYKELVQQITDKESQIKNLEIAIEKVKQDMIGICPYKVGDLVEVESRKDKLVQVYVSDIKVYSYWDTGDGYEYKFTKPKKDGTMGQQSAGIYHLGDELKMRKI